MDLQIAAAFDLSPELVWFSRQSYAEEVSSFLQSDQEPASGDDFTHALFELEQLTLTQDKSFDDDMEIESPRRLPNPTPTTSPIKPIAASPPPDNHGPSKMDRVDTPSLTHCPSPLRDDPSPVQRPFPNEAVPRPYGSGRRRSAAVLPWQTAILRRALVSTSGSRPGNKQLRDLAQCTHLPVSRFHKHVIPLRKYVKAFFWSL